MKQVHLKPLLCLLLTISATAQPNIAGTSQEGFGSPQLGMGQIGFRGMSSFSRMGASAQFNEQQAAGASPWPGLVGQSGFEEQPIQSGSERHHVQTPAVRQPVVVDDIPPPPPSTTRFIQQDDASVGSGSRSNGHDGSSYTTVNNYSSRSVPKSISYDAPSYTKSTNYGSPSYTKTTSYNAPPYGGSPKGGSSYGGSPKGGSSYGASPKSGSSYGGSSYGGSSYGGSSYGGSSYGGSPKGGSSYGASPKSGSSYGGSSYGGSPKGGSSYGGSPKGGSSYGGPSYGGQSYGGQSYGGPSYGGSSYGGSSYGGSSYGGSSYGGSSYGGSSYGGSYNTPTGPPYGIQSTGEYTKYYPEVLDLSRCGPPPTENPCTLYGPQYFPLPGYPHCYIQCAFERLFVKPCPANLVWNPRINVCDWSTVAAPYSNNDYGSTSYGNKGDQYSSSGYETIMSNYGGLSSYPYGRKKRSTTERKKRGYTS